MTTIVNHQAPVVITVPARTVTLSSSGQPGPQGAPGAPGPGQAVLTVPGTLTVGARPARYYLSTAATITGVTASVSTAPTGAAVIVDVNRNGTSIFTTQANRPTIAAGGYVALDVVPAVTSLDAGDYLTVDVDQIGSTVPGATLVVQVTYTLES